MAQRPPTKLAKAIRKARDTSSQQVFATELGTSMVTLRAWEKGVQVPGLHRHVEALVSAGVPRELLTAALTPTQAATGHTGPEVAA